MLECVLLCFIIQLNIFDVNSIFVNSFNVGTDKCTDKCIENLLHLMITYNYTMKKKIAMKIYQTHKVCVMEEYCINKIKTMEQMVIYFSNIKIHYKN